MPTVEREITVPAEPDEVWEALTDEDLREEWLHDREADEPRRVVHDEVADEESRELAFRWGRPGEQPSEVRFLIEAVPAGTRVLVRETAPSVPSVPWGPRLHALAGRVPAFA